MPGPSPGRPHDPTWPLRHNARARSFQTARAVAWSFFGIRRGADYANDVGKLNPVHVIVAGVLAAVLFVIALITLIHWVVGSGVAAS
ncbi:MAG: DUF2970 domain-containing protein [Burkholderiales bacterium]|nr:DUF2970 domain-containing protein [Burkholderiales bacterium]